MRTKPGLFYLPTTDLDAARTWYARVLGLAFEAPFDCGDGVRMAEHHFADAPTPRPFVALIEGPGVRVADTSVPVMSINVDDVDGLRDRLGVAAGAPDAGASTLLGEEAGGGARWLRFRDRDGNLLEANHWEWDHL